MERKEEIRIIENSISWQGEGFNSGKRVLILRFKTCNRIEFNIGCDFCDTKIKLRNSYPYLIKLNTIQEIINKEKVGLLITGGEPTFSFNFDSTLNVLNRLDYPFADIESNGHRLIHLINQANTDKLINHSYSPKIFTEEELQKEKVKSKELSEFSNVYFKIVYENRDLIKEYLEFVEELNINQRVFLMIKGTTKKELLKNAPEVFDEAEKYKFNFSSRDHIIYNFL